jgi:RNA polymerase sigma factor (sigma-70 family)
VASIPAHRPVAGPFRSRRLLALAPDGRLVEQVRRGNEVAFEVVFERHGPAILAFCRHMLGSREEAEDAVQHTFAAAYRDLQRAGEREIALKPWLFAIARNRCMSLLRARQDLPVGEPAFGDLPSAGLAEQVEQRAELRRLLADLRELPDDQRAALLMAELGDLAHAEVATVLGCEVRRVKALVFRARSALIARREAREVPCERIREQLATLRGGSLRRTELRLHLRDCAGCRAYREQVRQQRRMLAAALPVAPTMGLKSSVLAAVGLGGSSAAGLTTAGGAFGGATLAKVAIAGVLAGGGVVAGDAAMDSSRRAVSTSQPAAAPPANAEQEALAGTRSSGAGRSRRAGGAVEPPATRGSGRGQVEAPAATTPAPPGLSKATRGKRRGGDGKAHEDTANRGRGPIEAPPPRTPVRRGPPDKSSKHASPPSQANSGTQPAPKAGARPAPRANADAKPASPIPGSPEIPRIEPPRAKAKR